MSVDISLVEPKVKSSSKLPEVILVVLLVGILLGLLVPAFMKAKNHAEEKWLAQIMPPGVVDTNLTPIPFIVETHLGYDWIIALDKSAPNKFIFYADSSLIPTMIVLPAEPIAGVPSALDYQYHFSVTRKTWSDLGREGYVVETFKFLTVTEDPSPIILGVDPAVLAKLKKQAHENSGNPPMIRKKK